MMIGKVVRFRCLVLTTDFNRFQPSAQRHWLVWRVMTIAHASCWSTSNVWWWLKAAPTLRRPSRAHHQQEEELGGWGARRRRRRRRRPPAGIGFSGLGAIGSRKERADGERVVARRKIITLDRSIRSSGNADVDKARQENKGERQGDNQHLLRSRAHHQLIPRPATGRRTHTRGRSSRG